MENIKIKNERIDSYTYDEGTFYVYIRTTIDEGSKDRREIVNPNGEKVVIGIADTKSFILDQNFNRLIVKLGKKDGKEISSELIAKYTKGAKNTFLGGIAPFDLICGRRYDLLPDEDCVLPRDQWVGVWEIPTHEQKVHYQSLLENSMLGKSTDKIVELEHEDQQFYIYYTGVTYYDEQAGKKVLVDGHDFLDAGLNRHALNVKKEDAKEMLQRYLAAGCPAFIGSHSPLKSVYIGNGEDAELPNYDADTVGIWIASSEEEKKRYTHLINKKKVKKMEKELTA